MISEETEAKFVEKGVTLVSARAGRLFFKKEMTRKAGTNNEIICGEGPWEQHEAEIGQIENNLNAVAGNALNPLLGHAKVTTRSNGDKVITLYLGDNHAYLEDHRIDEIPVLPAAVALDVVAEAASKL